jgi:membrane protease YdiL (CAAX protease family)
MTAMSITPSGWVFLFVTTVYVPFAAIRGARRVRAPGGTPTRAQHLVSVVLTQGMGLLIAYFAATYEDLHLFPAPHLGWKHAAMAVGFLVPTLATLPWRWSWKSSDEKRRMMWMLPNKPSDLVWWVGVALVAGIVEEFVYRGVMVTLWERILGSWWPAVLVCSVAFAVAHFVQGVRTVVIIAIFAIGNHLIVRASGDLYTAMAIHFLYDLLAGVILLRLATRDGLTKVGAAV